MSFSSVRLTGSISSHSCSVRAPAGQYAQAPSWIVTGLPASTIASGVASTCPLTRHTRRTRLLVIPRPPIPGQFAACSLSIRPGVMRTIAPDETKNGAAFRRAVLSQSVAVLVLLLEFALDGVAVPLRAGARRLALRLLGTGLSGLSGLSRLLRLLFRLLLLVHDLADLHRGCPERFGRGFDPLDVVRLECI